MVAKATGKRPIFELSGRGIIQTGLSAFWGRGTDGRVCGWGGLGGRESDNPNLRPLKTTKPLTTRYY